MNKPNLINQIVLNKAGRFVRNGFWESTWHNGQPAWSRFYRMDKVVGITHTNLSSGRIITKDYYLIVR